MNRMNRYTLEVTARILPTMGKKENIDDILGGGEAKPAKAAAKPAKAAAKPAKAAAKPAKAAAKPAKAAAKPAKKSEKAERGTGKFYMSPEEKQSIGKKLLTAAKGKTVKTSDLAEKFGVPSFKVRLASVELLKDKANKLVVKADGNQLTYSVK